GNRASSRNLHILEKWIKESGGYESATERQLVYLGNERWVNNLVPEAIEAYTAYLSKSQWDEEKLQVHYKLATYYIETKQYGLAYNHATSALIINPAWIEPWLALAQLQLNEGKYSNARVFLNSADECTPPNTPLVIYPLNYSYLPKVLRYKVNLLEGNLEDALLDIQKCLKVRPSEELNDQLKGMGSSPLKESVQASVLLSRPDVDYDIIRRFTPSGEALTAEEITSVSVEIKYQGYIERQKRQVQKMDRMEKVMIPEDFDYNQIPGLLNESRQKLEEVRPRTFGQASRISGVTPTDLQLLSVYLQSRRRKGGS
ncbi:MAG TPA: hypothetical protein PLV56_05865, partial [Synergistales bacterium]|nr:hypothetical protein [Synergistales bacterium]